MKNLAWHVKFLTDTTIHFSLQGRKTSFKEKRYPGYYPGRSSFRVEKLEGKGTLSFSADLQPVLCDSIQLKQAIKNIVINAKQAMPAEGVLEVSAQNEEITAEQIPHQSPGSYVCVTLKDNGSGIAKEDLPRIFDPYFTTRQDVTTKGLGLGLTIVQSIISRHKGSIRVTSELGEGTSVRVYLPAEIA